MMPHHDVIMKPMAFLLLGVAFVVGQRYACECNPFRPPDYCSTYAVIQAVVVDKKGPLLPPGFSPDVDVESLDAKTKALLEFYWREFGPYEYTLDIVDTYGRSPPLQDVPSLLNMPSGPALCGLELTNGTRYLLGVKNHGIWLTSNACKFNMKLESADDVPQDVLDAQCAPSPLDPRQRRSDFEQDKL